METQDKIQVVIIRDVQFKQSLTMTLNMVFPSDTEQDKIGYVINEAVDASKEWRGSGDTS